MAQPLARLWAVAAEIAGLCDYHQSKILQY